MAGARRCTHETSPCGNKETRRAIASPTRKWPRRFGWRDASGGDLSRDPRAGGEHPSRGPRLCERGLPLIMGSWGAGGHHPRGNCTTATQKDDTAADKDALQPPTGTPSAEPRRTRTRRSRTRGSRWPSATTGTTFPSPRGDARPVAATRTCRSGPEAGPHDGPDGTRDATGV